MKKSKAIFLDRDGVINRNRADYVKNWQEFVFLPNAKEAIKLLTDKNFKIIIVTNQSAVGREIITEEQLQEIHRKMVKELEKAGGKIEKIYYCPHAPWDNCKCRKPKPGMLLKASQELGIDLKKAFFIGDDKKDLEAGKAVGCKTLIVNEKEDVLAVVKKILQLTKK
ncbi:MAG: D-glycero-beta-D-manno-heptose 1,7-bisphosphate 7-phosphatase [Candidatus Thermoplasmatota archaeon]|nr:D-glycero-beta-D-manno-heptose 1,7-bisphosphate 7-phosphatase [Candidatus Thermoplasmatota archaeon]